jgi:hypothetical protein
LAIKLVWERSETNNSKLKNEVIFGILDRQNLKKKKKKKRERE